MTEVLEKSAIKTKKKQSLVQLVDELGLLMAQIAPLKEREKEIKEKIVASGKDQIKGLLYQASVSHYVMETLIAEIVKGFLTPKEIKAATKETPCTRVNVRALTETKKK